MKPELTLQVVEKIFSWLSVDPSLASKKKARIQDQDNESDITDDEDVGEAAAAVGVALPTAPVHVAAGAVAPVNIT